MLFSLSVEIGCLLLISSFIQYFLDIFGMPGVEKNRAITPQSTFFTDRLCISHLPRIKDSIHTKELKGLLAGCRRSYYCIVFDYNALTLMRSLYALAA